MIGQHVPDTLTPFSFEEAAEAMDAALYAELGSVHPSRPVLALALAKTALETGRWQKIHCYNWGNIKALEKDPGMFTTYWCDEIIPGRGRVVVFPDGEERDSKGSKGKGRYENPPGHPWTRFKAYANRFDGAHQYIDFVAKKQRYKLAWQELLEGDAVGYVSALKRAGYFTADEVPYRNAVVKLQREFIGRLEKQDVPPVVLPDIEWEKLRQRAMSLHIVDLQENHRDDYEELCRECAA